MPTSGRDVFFVEAGAAETRHCLICGAECEVERGVLGATAWAETLAGARRWHDRFTCPHTDQAWHAQAATLAAQRDAAAGRRQRELLEADLREILSAAGLGV
ncbi:MAG: hypothetical protein KA764_15310 [Anaerolineales bacterium]|nr:hypothetical protein [Anaerolineales bacterium]